jgi:hypothetical protein
MTAPEQHLRALVGAMSENPALADDLTESFDYPDRQWARVRSAEATEAYISEFAPAQV